MTANGDMSLRRPDDNEPLEQLSADALALVDETVARITDAEVEEHLRRALSQSGYSDEMPLMPADPDAEAQAAAIVAAVGTTGVAQVTRPPSIAQNETERVATRSDEDQPPDRYPQGKRTGRQNPQHSYCPHTPKCPHASSPDREAAQVVDHHPEQGWTLLCNGIVIFEDTVMDSQVADIDTIEWPTSKWQHAADDRWQASSAS